MLLNKDSMILIGDGQGGLKTATLYGQDVSSFLKDTYSDIKNLLSLQEVDLNSLAQNDTVKSLKKALEHCVSVVLEQSNKDLLKQMLRDKAVQFKPELMHKVKEVIKLKESYNKIEASTKKLHTASPEVGEFFRNKSSVEQYNKENDSQRTPEAESDIDLK